jgi:hypothetical protein
MAAKADGLRFAVYSFGEGACLYPTVPKVVYANGVAINYSDTIPNPARNVSNVASGLCLQPTSGGQVIQNTCSSALNWRLPLF